MYRQTDRQTDRQTSVHYDSNRVQLTKCANKNNWISTTLNLFSVSQYQLSYATVKLQSVIPTSTITVHTLLFTLACTNCAIYNRDFV